MTTFFVLLVVYQLKHFVADYLLQQNKYMLGKFKPGWEFVGPLTAHVGVHAFLTYNIALIAPIVTGHFTLMTIVYAILIALFDAAIHFVMDRLKAGPRWMGRWKSVTAAEYIDAQDTISKKDLWHDQTIVVNARRRLRGNVLFWCSLGFDQMVHHLTHYGCIYFILKLVGVL